jgi:hypothetical protein
MTILAILALLFGIFLVTDGALNRGLLSWAAAGAGSTVVSILRLGEVLLGGVIFTVLGFLASPC